MSSCREQSTTTTPATDAKHESKATTNCASEPSPTAEPGPSSSASAGDSGSTRVGVRDDSHNSDAFLRRLLLVVCACVAVALVLVRSEALLAASAVLEHLRGTLHHVKNIAEIVLKKVAEIVLKKVAEILLLEILRDWRLRVLVLGAFVVVLTNDHARSALLPVFLDAARVVGGHAWATVRGLLRQGVVRLLWELLF